MLARLQSTGFVVRIQYDGRVTHRVVNPNYSSNPETAREWIRQSARAKKESSRKQEIRVPENRDAYIERIPKENTNRKRITTTTTYEDNKPRQASSSRCASLSVLSGGSEEPAAEAPDKAGTNAQGDALARELGKEFRLSGKQRRVVGEYCESHGQGYVLSKAEIVRSAPRKNAAGALLAALSEDWQPTVSIGTEDEDGRPSYDELAERMGWEW